MYGQSVRALRPAANQNGPAARKQGLRQRTGAGTGEGGHTYGWYRGIYQDVKDRLKAGQAQRMGSDSQSPTKPD